MTEQVGYITATTKVPRLYRVDDQVSNVKLIAWSNGQVTWELVTDE